MHLRLTIAAAILPFALPVVASAQTAPPSVPAAASKFSIDTPIQDLYADPAAKAVMDKHLPGLTTIPQYEMIKAISLRQLQPYSDGKLTDALLAAVEADLVKIK
ncbi:hypothetical protein TPR58_02055 [Sphingomonas sp. HF-S3]|uniref:Uncharacterized protein n=1 Tax=Sphingomonas rustica TaxID=3103142 RepID=A0ABV0B2X1_9SPHN